VHLRFSVMEIAGRNALVTGGAQRVGRAIALELADAGADVFIHYNSSAEPADEAAGVVRAHGVRAAIGSADLSDPASAAGLVEEATDALGPISILVNSASGFPEDAIADVSIDALRSTLDLSLVTPIVLTRAFAAALPADMTGAVVNVTDVKTATPYRTHFSYIVAKGGLDAMTRAAAVGLAPRIRVNAVALGIILAPPGRDESYAERLADRIPLGRPGGTTPVAAAVRHLVENDFVTGEILRVDGGGHLV
jgi:NAD(P)-dependent dehydrogenase (short-subunit alcohol dehydrogenase family)